MLTAKSLRVLSAVCVLALLGPAAQAGENEALKYNNAIAGLNKKLNEAGMRLGLAISPVLKGQAADLDKVRKAMKEVEKVLTQVKKDVAVLKVPDSDSGRKLAKVYARFLKGQEDMVKKDLPDIVRVVEGANPPDKEGQDRLLKMLVAVGQREQTILTDLQAAQREFAREHGIDLKKE
jgi:hypothetical protein